ncbi:uncharacterized protein LOC129002050 [Macrosteles quadrilineatus]|uniref:uncharacterized protein LOC129002050 n=1 Tax=Macrosteles quadrilineatus TaxID=74068 RepID=UPI0023E3463D|nr:uncharacterized protein LOC129002050 [Macrosteles quadrilineatus]XP_054285536.1 uncharacterized protein LOC129002050 [Macrosteles quadrilineatus]XP_054285537.1 uncharacterized protein LOC129002050 [Macrosteles quadrilineatus]
MSTQEAISIAEGNSEHEVEFPSESKKRTSSEIESFLPPNKKKKDHSDAEVKQNTLSIEEDQQKQGGNDCMSVDCNNDNIDTVVVNEETTPPIEAQATTVDDKTDSNNDHTKAVIDNNEETNQDKVQDADVVNTDSNNDHTQAVIDNNEETDCDKDQATAVVDNTDSNNDLTKEVIDNIEETDCDKDQATAVVDNTDSNNDLTKAVIDNNEETNQDKAQATAVVISIDSNIDHTKAVINNNEEIKSPDAAQAFCFMPSGKRASSVIDSFSPPNKKKKDQFDAEVKQNTLSIEEDRQKQGGNDCMSVDCNNDNMDTAVVNEETTPPIEAQATTVDDKTDSNNDHTEAVIDNNEETNQDKVQDADVVDNTDSNNDHTKAVIDNNEETNQDNAQATAVFDNTDSNDYSISVLDNNEETNQDKAQATAGVDNTNPNNDLTKTVIDNNEETNQDKAQATAVFENTDSNHDYTNAVLDNNEDKAQATAVVDNTDSNNDHIKAVIDNNEETNQDKVLATAVVDNTDSNNDHTSEVIDNNEETNQDKVWVTAVVDNTDSNNDYSRAAIDNNEETNQDKVLATAVVDNTDSNNDHIKAVIIDNNEETNQDKAQATAVVDNTDSNNDHTMSVVDNNEETNQDKVQATAVVDNTDSNNDYSRAAIDDNEETDCEKVQATAVVENTDSNNDHTMSVVDNNEETNQDKVQATVVVDNTDSNNDHTKAVIDNTEETNNDKVQATAVVDNTDSNNDHTSEVIDNNEETNQDKVWATAVVDNTDSNNDYSRAAIDNKEETDCEKVQATAVVENTDSNNDQTMAVVDNSDETNKDKVQATALVDNTDYNNDQTMAVVDNTEETNLDKGQITAVVDNTDGKLITTQCELLKPPNQAIKSDFLDSDFKKEEIIEPSVIDPDKNFETKKSDIKAEEEQLSTSKIEMLDTSDEYQNEGSCSTDHEDMLNSFEDTIETWKICKEIKNNNPTETLESPTVGQEQTDNGESSDCEYKQSEIEAMDVSDEEDNKRENKFEVLMPWSIKTDAKEEYRQPLADDPVWKDRLPPPPGCESPPPLTVPTMDKTDDTSTAQKFTVNSTLNTEDILKSSTAASFGRYTVEFEINQLPKFTKDYLTRHICLENIVEKFSGATVNIGGQYISSWTDMSKSEITSIRPLHLHINGPSQQSLELALKYITKLIAEGEEDKDVLVYKMFLGLSTIPSDFDLNKHIVGDNGANLQYIMDITGAEVTLRGKSSGYLEINSDQEAATPLHLLIRHTDCQGLNQAKEIAANLIQTVGEELKRFSSQSQPIAVELSAYTGSSLSLAPDSIPSVLPLPVPLPDFSSTISLPSGNPNLYLQTVAPAQTQTSSVSDNFTPAVNTTIAVNPVNPLGVYNISSQVNQAPILPLLGPKVVYEAAPQLITQTVQPSSTLYGTNLTRPNLIHLSSNLTRPTVPDFQFAKPAPPQPKIFCLPNVNVPPPLRNPPPTTPPHLRPPATLTSTPEMRNALTFRPQKHSQIEVKSVNENVTTKVKPKKIQFSIINASKSNNTTPANPLMTKKSTEDTNCSKTSDKLNVPETSSGAQTINSTGEKIAKTRWGQKPEDPSSLGKINQSLAKLAGLINEMQVGRDKARLENIIKLLRCALPKTNEINEMIRAQLTTMVELLQKTLLCLPSNQLSKTMWEVVKLLKAEFKIVIGNSTDTPDITSSNNKDQALNETKALNEADKKESRRQERESEKSYTRNDTSSSRHNSQESKSAREIHRTSSSRLSDTRMESGPDKYSRWESAPSNRKTSASKSSDERKETTSDNYSKPDNGSSDRRTFTSRSNDAQKEIRSEKYRRQDTESSNQRTSSSRSNDAQKEIRSDKYSRQDTESSNQRTSSSRLNDAQKEIRSDKYSRQDTESSNQRTSSSRSNYAQKEIRSDKYSRQDTESSNQRTSSSRSNYAQKEIRSDKYSRQDTESSNQRTSSSRSNYAQKEIRSDKYSRQDTESSNQRTSSSRLNDAQKEIRSDKYSRQDTESSNQRTSSRESDRKPNSINVNIEASSSTQSKTQSNELNKIVELLHKALNVATSSLGNNSIKNELEKIAILLKHSLPTDKEASDDQKSKFLIVLDVLEQALQRNTSTLGNKATNLTTVISLLKRNLKTNTAPTKQERAPMKLDSTPAQLSASRPLPQVQIKKEIDVHQPDPFVHIIQLLQKALKSYAGTIEHGLMKTQLTVISQSLEGAVSKCGNTTEIEQKNLLKLIELLEQLLISNQSSSNNKPVELLGIMQQLKNALQQKPGGSTSKTQQFVPKPTSQSSTSSSAPPNTPKVSTDQHQSELLQIIRLLQQALHSYCSVLDQGYQKDKLAQISQMLDRELEEYKNTMSIDQLKKQMSPLIAMLQQTLQNQQPSNKSKGLLQILQQIDKVMNPPAPVATNAFNATQHANMLGSLQQLNMLQLLQQQMQGGSKMAAPFQSTPVQTASAPANNNLLQMQMMQMMQQLQSALVPTGVGDQINQISQQMQALQQQLLLLNQQPPTFQQQPMLQSFSAAPAMSQPNVSDLMRQLQQQASNQFKRSN